MKPNLKNEPDVTIQVVNNTQDVIRAMLYLADIEPSAKNYMIGAWKHGDLGPQDVLSTKLSYDLAVGAIHQIPDMKITSPLKDAAQNDRFVINNYPESTALKIDKEAKVNVDGTITITNNCNSYEWGLFYKSGQPAIAVELGYKDYESTLIKPKIGLALVRNEITSDFIDAATFSHKDVFDLSNQSRLTINVNKNIATGEYIFYR